MLFTFFKCMLVRLYRENTKEDSSCELSGLFDWILLTCWSENRILFEGWKMWRWQFQLLMGQFLSGLERRLMSKFCRFHHTFILIMPIEEADFLHSFHVCLFFPFLDYSLKTYASALKKHILGLKSDGYGKSLDHVIFISERCNLLSIIRLNV